MIDRTSLLLLLGLAMAAPACEETLSADDVPYVEQVIVQGMLTTDSPGDTIRFVRTLPLNVPYDPAKAELFGVTGEVTEAGTGTVYKLVPVARGAYVAQGLRPAVGKRYTLTATWKNEEGNEYHLTGSTTVPVPPVIDTIYSRKRTDTTAWIDGIPQQGYYIETLIQQPVADVGYGLNYQVLTSGPFPDMGMTYSYHFDEVLKRKEDADADGKVHLRPGEWNGTLYEPPPYPVKLSVYAFDRSYYDYFMSRDAYDDDEIFGAPGEKTRWNVEGDGFGIFTARSVSVWEGLVQ